MKNSNDAPSLNPKEPMRCYVCDAKEWHVVLAEKGRGPEPVHSQSKIQICKGCGSAVHEVDVSKEEKIKEFYRKEYRPKPNIANLITTTHKINYIRVFLKDFLQKNQGKQLVVGDVGAATGYVLNFFRGLGHKVSGSELTLTYRRMAEHYYGIPLAEELETKHKYDLIVIYHVLEHLMEPDKKLAHYVTLLNEGGKMLIATPEWFSNYLDDSSGLPANSFDVLFHKNHINLFSATSLQNLFRKAGLRVIKEDHIQYGQTYFLEKSEGVREPSEWLTKEGWEDINKTMLSHEYAIRLHSAGKFREAVEIVPRFPEAWLAQIFGSNSKDVAKQTDIFEIASKHCSENGRFITARGQWHYQQGRMAKAIEDLSKVVSFKPAEDLYMFLGYAYAQSGKSDEAMQAFSIACSMDPRKWAEAQGWMLNISSDRPTWDERILAEAASRLKLPKPGNATGQTGQNPESITLAQPDVAKGQTGQNHLLAKPDPRAEGATA